MGSRNIIFPVDEIIRQRGTVVWDGKDIILKGYTWATCGGKIEIDSTATFYFDIIFSNEAGSLLYIGFEKYDEQSTPTSNDSCTYIYSSSNEAVDKHIHGAVNLSKDALGSNTKYIKLRILNSWNDNTNTTSVSKISSIILREVHGSFVTPKISPSGDITADTFFEYKDAKIYKTSLIEADTFYEI